MSSEIRQFLGRVKEACLLAWLTWFVLGFPFFSTGILLMMFYNEWIWPFALLYSIWLVLDWNTPKRGSRRSEWARNWPMWKAIADSFPIKTVKTADLPTDRNYVFAAHPHGVLGTSTALMLATNGTDFRTHFPGLKTTVVTLPVNLWFPFRRECLIGMGILTSDACSIGHVLSKPAEGHVVGIVPGGVSEMNTSKPGQYKLVLKNRKGFVKLAIKYGADLVPIYHFGEDEIFVNINNSEGSLVHKYQTLAKHFKGSSFPMAYGRSFLSAILPEKMANKLPPILRYGALPFKKPIVTVVGAPIHVQKNPEPNKEEIDALHTLYCAKLKELFNKHKHELGGLAESAELEFI